MHPAACTAALSRTGTHDATHSVSTRPEAAIPDCVSPSRSVRDWSPGRISFQPCAIHAKLTSAPSGMKTRFLRRFFSNQHNRLVPHPKTNLCSSQVVRLFRLPEIDLVRTCDVNKERRWYTCL